MLMLHGVGKRIVCMLICCLTVVLMMAMPVSAAMTKLDPKQEDRQVSAVHYSASRNSTVIGNLEDGTELTVLGETEYFYRIDCGDMDGYIAKEQIKIDDNGCYYVNCNAKFSDTVTLPGRDATELEGLQYKLLELAEEQLGVPYVYGGTSPYGFDCSGFVQYIYNKLGYSLNRGATSQMSDGMIVEAEDLKPGDLVFFQGTSSESTLSSHVGIYVGDGKFIHAASKGISYSSLDQDYYADHFLCARRVLLSSVITYSSAPETNDNVNRSSGLPTGAFFMGKMALATV